MIDFGQRQIIGEKIHYSKYYDVIISSCVRNYEYLIGDSNVDTAESIPTKEKKSWMHTNPNICHLWHTSNRCTILDINLYSGYPHKSKQIKQSKIYWNHKSWKTAKSELCLTNFANLWLQSFALCGPYFRQFWSAEIQQVKTSFNPLVQNRMFSKALLKETIKILQIK